MHCQLKDCVGVYVPWKKRTMIFFFDTDMPNVSYGRFCFCFERKRSIYSQIDLTLGFYFDHGFGDALDFCYDRIDNLFYGEVLLVGVLVTFLVVSCYSPPSWTSPAKKNLACGVFVAFLWIFECFREMYFSLRGVVCI